MLLPLRDAECRQCHDPILRLAASALSTKAVDAAPSVDASLLANYGADPYAEGAAGTSYHTLRGHDGVNIRCVRCHTSHTTGGHLADQFISRPIVQPICRECHPHL